MRALEDPEEEYRWQSAKVPENVRWIHMECLECGDEIVVSPRFHTEVMSSIYCTDCEHGPPYGKTKVEFDDGTVLENPYRDYQTVNEYMEDRS